MLFIDSNIWCYYFDSSAEQHEKVATFLEGAIEEHELCVNTLVLMEIAHYAVKQLGAVKGREKMQVLLSLPLRIYDFDYSLLDESVEALCEHTHTGIGGRDATVVATMENERIETLVTHDRAFTRIDDITVVDPVEDS